MSHRLRRAVRRRGAQAALGTLVACAALAGIGAANSVQDATVNTAAASWDPADVQIATGESVTWNWDTSPGVAHNLVADGGPAEDPDWSGELEGFKTSGQYTRQFTKPGVYAFLCQAHASMKGTVTVEGDPVEPTPTGTPTETPDPTPTATATATATATPTVGPGQTPIDDPRSTPPASDTIAPAISALRLKRLRHGVRVTFTLSETSTVTLTVRKGERTVRTVRLQARSGTRTVRVRRLPRGRHTVGLQARDAAGNRSETVSSSIRIRRR
jgi:plastocyanin